MNENLRKTSKLVNLSISSSMQVKHVRSNIFNLSSDDIYSFFFAKRDPFENSIIPYVDYNHESM